MDKTYTHISSHYYNNIPPYTFKVKNLNYRQLIYLENLYENNPNLTYLEAYEFGIEKIYKNDIEYTGEIPYELKKKVGEYIFNISEVSLEELEQLKLSIELHFNKTFQSDTWKCSVCQKRKLDRVRNCGYRSEKNKNKDFSILVGDKLYTYCPMYDINKELLSNAIECYNIYESKFLPEAGGFYDQTKFFVIATSLIKQKINEEREKELEDMKKDTSKF